MLEERGSTSSSRLDLILPYYVRVTDTVPDNVSIKINDLLSLITLHLLATSVLNIQYSVASSDITLLIPYK